MSFLYGTDVYIAWGVLLLGFIWFAYSDGWFNKSMWVSTESDEEELMKKISIHRFIGFV